MTRGPILDRGLSLEVLDAALAVARAAPPREDDLRQLEVRLREFVSEQEATTKTRKILTRIWVRPPEDAEAMLRWAIDHASPEVDNRVLHVGAMLATYPFFGEVCAAAGRQLALSGEVVTAAAQDRLRQLRGDRPSVDVGARKSLRTLQLLDLLHPSRPSGRAVSTPGNRAKVPSDLAPWITHALLLSRGSERISSDELRSAPELFMLDVRPNGADYPFLERASESGGRRIWIPRS